MIKAEMYRNIQHKRDRNDFNDTRLGRSSDTSHRGNKQHHPEIKVMSLINNLCEISARLTRILSEANDRLKEKGVSGCDNCRTTAAQYKHYLKTIKILQMLVSGVFEKEQINKLDATQKRMLDVYLLTDIQRQANMFFKQNRCCEIEIKTPVRGVIKKNPKFEHNLKCFLIVLQRTVAELILQICFLKSQPELFNISEQLRIFDIPTMHLKIVNFEYTNLTDKIIYLIDFETRSTNSNIKKRFDGYCVLCAKEEMLDLINNLNDVLSCAKRVKLAPKESKIDSKKSTVCCNRYFPHIHGELNGNPVVLKFNEGNENLRVIKSISDFALEGQDKNINLPYENEDECSLYESAHSITEPVKQSDQSSMKQTSRPDEEKQYETRASPELIDFDENKPHGDIELKQSYNYDGDNQDKQKLYVPPENIFKIQDSDENFYIKNQSDKPVEKQDTTTETADLWNRAENMKEYQNIESQEVDLTVTKFDEKKEIQSNFEKPESNLEKFDENKENVKDEDIWNVKSDPSSVYLIQENTGSPLQSSDTKLKHSDKQTEKTLNELRKSDENKEIVKDEDILNVTSDLSQEKTESPLKLSDTKLKHPDKEIEKRLNEIGVDKILNVMKPAQCSNVNTLLSNTPSNDAMPYVISLQSLPLNEQDIEYIAEKTKTMNATPESKMRQEETNLTDYPKMNHKDDIPIDESVSHDHIYNIFDKETGPYIPSLESLVLQNDELQTSYDSKQNNDYKNKQNPSIKTNFEVRFFHLENQPRFCMPSNLFAVEHEPSLHLDFDSVNITDINVKLSTSSCYTESYTSCDSLQITPTESFNSAKSHTRSVKEYTADNSEPSKQINIFYKRDNVAAFSRNTSSEDLSKLFDLFSNDNLKLPEVFSNQYYDVKSSEIFRNSSTQIENNNLDIAHLKTKLEQLLSIDNQAQQNIFLDSFILHLIKNITESNDSKGSDSMILYPIIPMPDVTPNVTECESDVCQNMLNFLTIDSVDNAQILCSNNRIRSKLCTTNNNRTRLIETTNSSREDRTSQEFESSSLINMSHDTLQDILSLLSFVVNEEICKLEDDTTDSELEIKKKLKISEFIRKKILEKINVSSEVQHNLSRPCLEGLNFIEKMQSLRNRRFTVSKRKTPGKYSQTVLEVLEKYLINNTSDVFHDDKEINNERPIINEDNLNKVLSNHRKSFFKQDETNEMIHSESCDKIQTHLDKRQKFSYKIPSTVCRYKQRQSSNVKLKSFQSNNKNRICNIKSCKSLKNNKINSVSSRSNNRVNTQSNLLTYWPILSKSQNIKNLNNTNFIKKDKCNFINLQKKVIKPVEHIKTCMKFNISIKLPKPKFATMHYENIAFFTFTNKFQRIPTKHNVYRNYPIEKSVYIPYIIKYKVLRPIRIHYIVKRPLLTLIKYEYKLNIAEIIEIKYEPVLQVIRLYPSSKMTKTCDWSGDTQHVGRYSFSEMNLYDHSNYRSNTIGKYHNYNKICLEVSRNRFYRIYYTQLTTEKGSPLLLFDKFKTPLTDSKGYPTFVNGHATLRFNKEGLPVSDHLGNKLYDKKGNIYSPNRNEKFYSNFVSRKVERHVKDLGIMYKPSKQIKK